MLVVIFFAAAASFTAFYFGLQLKLWSLYILSGSFALTSLVGVFTISNIWDAPQGIKLFATAFLLELSLAIAAGIFNFVYGLPIALIALLMGFFFAALNPSGWLNEGLIPLGLISALAGTFLNVMSFLPQTTGMAINVSVLAIDVLLLVLTIRLYILGLIVLSIRVKLILGALVITLAPVVVLSIINLGTLRTLSEAQSNDSLRIETQVSINEIDSFFNTNLVSLESEAALPVVIAYFQQSPDERLNSSIEQDLGATLSTLKAKEMTYSPSYGLLDLSGNNLYDTDKNSQGVSEAAADYFIEAASTKNSYVTSVEFIPNTHIAYIYLISPVLDENNSLIGYLRLRYDARIIQSTITRLAGLVGSNSYPIIIDDNGIILADANDPTQLYHAIAPLSEAQYNDLLSKKIAPTYLTRDQITSEIPEVANAVLKGQTRIYEAFSVSSQETQSTVPVNATYGRLTTQHWYMVYFQRQTTLASSIDANTKSTVQLAVLMAILVSLFVTIFSNLFTRPILGLTQSAEKVADGDLDTQAKVTSRDEIGRLSHSFNAMTNQLRASIENLENRVQERTQLLAKQNQSLLYRSRQLQTVADVARSVVSNTNLESLLTSVTNLISERFNFYHVGIFLLDEANEYAVLRASNSLGGQRMLSRQHKLKVGQVGIVGYVTGTGTPRIATDVGNDAVFFNNPDLPETKSEMALPLVIENKVIGALDIQSIESNAFTEEDIALFSTLADQVSVAINNNRLLANTEKALEEAQTLHRQYLNQEWTKQVQQEANNNYKYTSQGLIPFEEKLPEIDTVFNSGRPITKTYTSSDRQGKPHSVLAVPINLRGETIGVIHLQVNEGNEFVWSENELLTVQTVADQVAQTLESARLFEQTIRRADRERRVLEITSKIRSTNDPQEMLQITLEELKRHLGASQAQIVINLPNPAGSNDPLTSQNKPQRG